MLDVAYLWSMGIFRGLLCATIALLLPLNYMQFQNSIAFALSRFPYVKPLSAQTEKE